MQLQSHANWQKNSRRNQRRRSLNGAVIAFLVMVSGLTWHCSEIPRSLAYSAFRGINKVGINLQTRGWNSIDGQQFQVRYRPEDADVAKIVLEAAEEAVTPVNSKLDYYPRGRMLVLVYPDRISLGRSFGWTADQSAMGVYWAGIIRVLSPSAWIQEASASEVAEEFRTTGPMVHEYVHLVVDYITRGNHPRWLTEGVAQHVERDITGYTLSEPFPSFDGAWLPFEELEISFDAPSTQPQAYCQSLAMVDFLTQEYGFESLLGILNRLGKGASLEAAWKAETGLTVNEFEEVLADRTKFCP